jgi:polyisoprenyl-phosphate glycosyltransferase
VRLAFDGIFSVTPLRAAWILGAVASVTASIYALWAIFERRFLDTSPQGFTALIVAITLVAGIRLLSLGLIGEYLGRVYDETKSRPQYIITEVVRTTTRTTSRPCR